MKTSAMIKLIDKMVDFLIYFLKESKQKEREINREKIEDNPSDWINERYGNGVQSDEQSDKSESGSNDSKTGS